MAAGGGNKSAESGPVSRAVLLGLFRIGVGVVLLQFTSTVNAYLQDFIIPEAFFFPYQLFEFVTKPSIAALNLVVPILFVAAILILLGVFTRLGALIYFAVYGYVFLIDSSTYNNHFYLYLILLALIGVCRTDSALSVKSWRSGTFLSGLTPSWNYTVFKLQFLLVYFLAGVQKLLNPHWLNGAVNRKVLEPLAKDWSLTPDQLHMLSLGYSYSGLIYDLAIGFLLWNRHTRLAGIVLAVLFSLANSFTLNIGSFPVMLMLSTLVFLDPEKTYLKVTKYLKRPVAKSENQGEAASRFLKFGFGLFFLVQVLVPFRHYAIPGNVSWTGEGEYFSWRMRMPHKDLIKFETVIIDNKNKGYITPNLNMSKSHMKALTHHPKNIYYVKEFMLANLPDQLTAKDVEIRVLMAVSMNGYPPQLVFDETKDLSKIELKAFQHNDFILPFTSDKE